MSKWISESTGLESKEQLKAHRKHMWEGLLLQNGLDKDLIAFWTEEEKAIEAAIWMKIDAKYENMKAGLKNELNKLSPEQLMIYFAEIGVDPQNLDKWL